MSVAEAPAKRGFADWVAADHTALLVMDLQADFASPDGAMGRMGVDLSGVPAALAAAERLVTAARAAGTPVIFVRLETDPALDSPVWVERMRRLGGDPDHDLELCRIGAPGAAFVGPQPAEGETVVSKLRYSAFYGTELDEDLAGRGIDTVVLCGLTTECCVDSTARHAFHMDYHVFVARDACAAYGADLHNAALRSLELNCAILADVGEFESVWRG
jgi:ureidoacrylate peracid hydrolase